MHIKKITVKMATEDGAMINPFTDFTDALLALLSIDSFFGYSLGDKGSGKNVLGDDTTT